MGNLRRFFLQWEKLLPKTPAFKSVTEFLDVKSESKQEKLRFYLALSTRQESTKTEVLLQYAKHSFHLYGAIRPQKIAFLACDVSKRFGSVTDKLGTYLDFSISSCASMAFSHMGTPFTALVPVIFYLDLVARRGDLFFLVRKKQNLSVCANVNVVLFVVLHVFHTVFVVLIPSRFADLIVLYLF